MTGAASPKPKRVVACDLCRVRKVRCNGAIPCNVCVVRGEQCLVTPKKRKRTVTEVEDVVAERLSRLESLMRSPKAPRTSDSVAQGPQSLPSTSLPSQSLTRKSPPVANEQSTISFPTPLPSTDGLPSRPQGSSNLGKLELMSPEDGSLLTTDPRFMKYHGPRSFLSICSVLGVKWVASRLGHNSFQSTAAKFVPIITRQMMTLSKPISNERKPDPPEHEAWDYVNAYFAEAPEAAFGVVREEVFRKHLQAYYNGSKEMEDSFAWNALRHTIIAYGCRIKLAKTLGFAKAVEVASGWFENAMALHTQLLYMDASLTSVKAMVVMASYSAGIGGPILAWMLSSCAIRIATAKGLHRSSPPSWGLPVSERNHRDWIFWAIYCLDRDMSAGSGRPSSIADHAVSCEIPEQASSGREMDTWYCQTTVKLAQLHSLTGRYVASPYGVQLQPEALIDVVAGLQNEADKFRATLPSFLDPCMPMDPANLPVGLTRDMAVQLQFKYYWLIMRIHAGVVNPWIRLGWPSPMPQVLEEGILRSSQMIAWASRQTLLQSTEIRLDPCCRLWLGLVVPMTACINVFVQILVDPLGSSTSSDLAIMELAVAHFARLEVLSDSKIAIPFAREMTQLARSFCDKVKADKETQSAESNQTDANGGVEAASSFLDPLLDPDWEQTANEIMSGEWMTEEFQNWALDGWLS